MEYLPYAEIALGGWLIWMLFVITQKLDALITELRTSTAVTRQVAGLLHESQNGLHSRFPANPLNED